MWQYVDSATRRYAHLTHYPELWSFVPFFSDQQCVTGC